MVIIILFQIFNKIISKDNIETILIKIIIKIGMHKDNIIIKQIILINIKIIIISSNTIIEIVKMVEDHSTLMLILI
jgi:hypothetical protein